MPPIQGQGLHFDEVAKKHVFITLETRIIGKEYIVNMME